MPILSSRGAASPSSFGFMLSSLGSDYWIGTLSGGTAAVAYAVSVDSGKNAYVSGTYGSNSDTFAIKFSQLGQLQWQKTISATRLRTSKVDSSGNQYLLGFSTVSPSVTAGIVKLSSAGAILWQKRLTAPSGSLSFISAFFETGGGIVYSGIASNISSAYVVKSNSSGVLGSQFRVTGTTNTSTGEGVCVDSGGNIYVTGENSTGTLAITSKISSTGTALWSRTLTGGTGGIANQRGTAIAIDTAGALYVGTAGDAGGFTNGSVGLAKYDSSGTLQWQRIINTTTTGLTSPRLSIDADNNICVIATLQSGSTGIALLAKYNSSGSLQWQRTLTAAGGVSGVGIDASVAGSIYVCGTASGVSGIWTARLPSDGSRTGTYTVGSTAFTYGISTYSESIGGMTAASDATVANTLTYTEATPTDSATNTALTQVTISV